jgi:hypothetical protein
VLLGAAGVVVLPAGILAWRQLGGLALLDISWGIPIGTALGFLAIATSNLARVRVQRTVGRAGGEGRARAARFLGVAAICIAVTAAISVGFYELLLHFEK